MTNQKWIGFGKGTKNKKHLRKNQENFGKNPKGGPLGKKNLVEKNMV